MKISTYYHSGNQEIEILEINGELTGMGAVKLEEYLYESLDEGRCSKIINLKHMKKADGLGLNVLECFINRGMRIRLFNAGLDILNLINLSGKEGILDKLYNCQEPGDAVLLFEKEILEEKSTLMDGLKRRCFERVNTALETDFKGDNSDNEDEKIYRAVISNLSVGGILINQISIFNKNSEKIANVREMAGREFCQIKFSLNGASRFIETDGECVWSGSVNEELYAGVLFKNMKQGCNEMIRDYVQTRKNS